MNRLYLLRHGVAVPHGTPGIPDDDRPLTGEGERRIRQVGKNVGWVERSEAHLPN